MRPDGRILSVTRPRASGQTLLYVLLAPSGDLCVKAFPPTPLFGDTKPLHDVRTDNELIKYLTRYANRATLQAGIFTPGTQVNSSRFCRSKRSSIFAKKRPCNSFRMRTYRRNSAKFFRMRSCGKPGGRGCSAIFASETASEPLAGCWRSLPVLDSAAAAGPAPAPCSISAC